MLVRLGVSVLCWLDLVVLCCLVQTCWLYVVLVRVGGSVLCWLDLVVLYCPGYIWWGCYFGVTVTLFHSRFLSSLCPLFIAGHPDLCAYFAWQQGGGVHHSLFASTVLIMSGLGILYVRCCAIESRNYVTTHLSSCSLFFAALLFVSLITLRRRRAMTFDHRFAGQGVKASTSRAEDPGFGSRL